MKPLFLFFAMLTLMSSLASYAAIETYEFESEQQRRQYNELAEALRCPKCQNQNIADSNAPIAKDMREKVYLMTKDGKTENDIVQFMVDRFGDFVVYEPRFDRSTLLLWGGPAVLGLLGIVVVILMASRRKSGESRGDEPLTSAQQEALNKILSEEEK